MVEEVQPFEKLYTKLNIRKIDPEGPKMQHRYRGFALAPKLEEGRVVVRQKGEHHRTHSVMLKPVSLNHSTPMASLYMLAISVCGIPCIESEPDKSHLYKDWHSRQRLF